MDWILLSEDTIPDPRRDGAFVYRATWAAAVTSVGTLVRTVEEYRSSSGAVSGVTSSTVFVPESQIRDGRITRR